jgi:tetratricopeptide (TPR) repeat protein
LAFDRENTLKKAEKLLRQGRLDAAIAEYLRVVEDQPRDWNTANTLGDLYARAGQTDLALEQYSRIADHLMHEGFYPKAAALYKKILKFNRDDESSQLQLAEISIRQGLIADARSLFNAIAARRRNRSDRRGEAEIMVRLGDLDPGDVEARLTAARTLEEMGECEQAAQRYKAIHDDLLEKGRPEEALDALRNLARLNPHDRDTRAALARAALASGDAAGEGLDRETAGSDPLLLFAFAESELRSGRIDSAREAFLALLGADSGLQSKVLDLGWSMRDSSGEAVFACVDAAVDAAITRSDFAQAATILQDFVSRVPGQIPSLLKLVEVCVDGGLESAMYVAQEQLTDAYLESGQAAEARVIAEDLVAREPWEQAHIERFRRALVMSRVSDPDTVIAERLSGQSPFMATDPFVDLSDVPGPAAAAGATGQAGEADLDGPDAGSEVQGEQPPPAQMPAAAAGVPSGPGADEIDLTGALSSLDAVRVPPPGHAPGPTLDEVFQRLRAESDNGPDYSNQHMTLARTFLEMGQVDEAIAALRTASKSPIHRFESTSLLGRIYRDRGEIGEAIEWLERAAEAPAPGLDEGRALLYDLGLSLDEAGETARALAVFLELQSEAGDYRDVPSRIDRLARAQAGG